MMKHLNKYLSLALALVLCLSLAACGESNEDYLSRGYIREVVIDIGRSALSSN